MPNSMHVSIKRSILPSPLKSAAANGTGGSTSGWGAEFRTANCGVETAFVTVKYTMFELPPPGGPLATVTEIVEGFAMTEAGTVAVSSSPPTKVVVRAVPFTLIVAPETKPEPRAVNVKLEPPGETLDGYTG